MSKYKVFDYYSQLPAWAKGVVIIGGCGIAWFGIVKPVWNAVKDRKKRDEQKKEAEAAHSDLKLLAAKGIHPTLSESQVTSFVSALTKAFSDCGTDEEAIYTVFNSMKNDADIAALMAAYGVKKYAGCGPWDMFQSGQELSLSGAISDELGAAEKKKINDILAKKGISYRFA